MRGRNPWKSKAVIAADCSSPMQASVIALPEWDVEIFARNVFDFAGLRDLKKNAASGFRSPALARNADNGLCCD
jgi:hypothetical protein